MRTTVFRHAAVFDGFRHRGRVGEVLVEDGRITAVGPDVTVPGARVVDVDGGLLLPGFTDAHVHPVQGGLERLGCDLSDLPAADATAYLEHVGAYAAGSAATGCRAAAGRWPPSPALPTAAALDGVVGDRPVALANRDHHGLWVSSRALALAGITRGRDPDPSTAGSSATPTARRPGCSTRARCVSSTTSCRWPARTTSTPRSSRASATCSRSASRRGRTRSSAPTRACRTAVRPTPARRPPATSSAPWSAPCGGTATRGAEQVAELVDKRADWTRGRFRATSVKVMQDGVAENGTAALVEPYLDRCGHATANTGISFVDPAELRRHVAELDRLGFQVHVHGLGDRGVREALDAFEGTDPRRRHHVAHLQLVHPDDVPRFAALGVAANIQALWACHDEQMTELTLPFLGRDRAQRQYPFRDLYAASARLVAGSDWPVSTPDPLAALHTAVHRTTHGDPGRAGTDPFLPGQALPVEAAFAAYTSGSAWVNHRDDAVGSRRARSPTWSSWTATRSRRRTTRGGAGPVDVGRRGVRPRRLTTPGDTRHSSHTGGFPDSGPAGPASN